jgi:hypothetical protein
VGHLGPHLDALFDIEATWTEQPMNGAEVIADRVLRNLTIKQQSR